MPYPNSHAARVTEPNYEKYARKNITEGVDVILGITAGKSEAQAYRFNKDKFTVDQAKKWLADNKVKYTKFEPASDTNLSEEYCFEEFKEKETFAVNGKVILSTGKWNGTIVNEEMLDDMIKSFGKLKDKRAVPLKLGHSKDQRLLQGNGYPAAGWITNIYRKGKQLFADLSEIPKTIKEYIESGAYKGVSIEFVTNWKNGEDGKTYSAVLTALALLGADIPAVVSKGINDWAKFYNEDEKDIITINYTEEEVAKRLALEALENETKLKEEKMSEELKKQLAEKEAEIKTLAENSDKLKTKSGKLQEESEKLKAEVAKFKAEKDAIAIEAFLSEYTKAENLKIIPAQKENVRELLKSFDSNVVITLSEDGKEVKLSQADLFKKFVDSITCPVKLNEESHHIEHEKLEGETPSDKLHFLTEKKMKEKDIKEYQEAFDIVCSEYPELANGKAVSTK